MFVAGPRPAFVMQIDTLNVEGKSGNGLTDNHSFRLERDPEIDPRPGLSLPAGPLELGVKTGRHCASESRCANFASRHVKKPNRKVAIASNAVVAAIQVSAVKPNSSAEAIGNKGFPVRDLDSAEISRIDR